MAYLEVRKIVENLFEYAIPLEIMERIPTRTQSVQIPIATP